MRLLSSSRRERGEVRDYNGNDQALAAHRATADHDAVQADKGTRTLRGFGDNSAAAAGLTRFGERSLAHRHSAGGIASIPTVQLTTARGRFRRHARSRGDYLPLRRDRRNPDRGG